MPLNTAKVKYVLFDWDGTLCNNRDTVLIAVNQVLQEYNLPDWNKIKSKRDSRLSLWDNFALIFGAQWQQAYARYCEIYKQLIPTHTKAFPYAKELLSLLKDEGVELMIMTNKDPQLLDIELPLLYNPNLFSRITAGHQAPKDKPYPEHLTHTLRGLLTPTEINPQDVWMVGDSNQDSDCALAARALAIRINAPLLEESSSRSPDIIWLKDFEQFYAMLAKN